MKTHFLARPFLVASTRLGQSALRLALVALVAAMAVPFSVGANEEEIFTKGLQPFILKPEDRLRISFPGAPDLTTELQVRRDGVASMPLVGEVLVAGMKPAELETELAAMYKDQLVSNEVRVVVLESHFTYYLEGEVLSPGIIQSFRQLSVLEAIIAAGGINKTTGKLKSIIVLRRQGAKYQRFELNLQDVLEGKNSEAFILEPYDVVSIPQRVW